MPDEMTGTKTTAKAFSQRLRAAMESKGMTSAGSRSGIDVAALAKAAGTSYEMARRYAEGAAVPRPDTLAAIARWLGTSPDALLWGRAAGAQLDPGLLEKCLHAVTEAQARTGRSLSTEKAAHLVALLYQEAIEGRFPEPSTLDLLVRA